MQACERFYEGSHKNVSLIYAMATFGKRWFFIGGMMSDNTDVMQLFVVMTTSIFGPSVAMVIGPYLLIMFAAATGAAWSLGRRTTESKSSSVFYFVRVVFTAILLTTVIAKLTAGFMPELEVDFLIAPVALIIGLIGDDWYQVIDWMLSAGKKIANRIFNKKMGE